MPRTPADIVSNVAILRQSDAFIGNKRIGMVATRRRLPSADELFDLAADGTVAAEDRPSVAMLGLRLATARMMAGQTAASLGGVLGLRDEHAAKMTISHYEKGRRRPSEDVLRELASVYKVSVPWLATGAHFLLNLSQCWPEWIEPWHEALIEAKGLLGIALRNRVGREFPFSDVAGAWSVLDATRDEDARWRKKWTVESMIAAMSGVLRARERARKRADMWTRVALTNNF